MQKAIRRSMEKEAMEFAVELMHTSKAFHSMVCNRLEVICHEDLDTLAAPHVFPFVTASLAASRDRYSKSIGEARLMIGNVIRMMCRSPKSRAGCHFAAAIGLRSSLEDFAPTIPDWANDQHTLAGRKLGRGLDHFRKRGQASPAADSRRPLRGRSLPAVGPQAAKQAVNVRSGLRADVECKSRFGPQTDIDQSLQLSPDVCVL
ncbi:hypothetical protein [Bradyrhizobium genosp. SA-3]|uniref:hypothetical protein n=1 Tax=Bradyrhizobium genosp. SA-3 TaxID=508868 RepID=UPI001028DAB1|nr:hypothetical protein [Bradyrhizobium genosp. SA-3]